MLPEIDRNSPIPIYQQIQAWMREQILTQVWEEDFQLQAEDDLANELGVNRGTLRNAIKALIDEGYLIRVHGKGTFVAKRVVEQDLAQTFNTFSEGLMSQNIPFTTQVFEQRLLVPDERVALMLDIAEGEPVMLLKRVRAVNDQLVIYLHNYVVTRYCPGIEQYNFEQQRLFDVMERAFELQLAWGRRTFEARAADDSVANALDIQVGAPVMYVQQITYSPDNVPLECSDMWIKGSSFRMTAVVRRGKKNTRADEVPEYLRTELTF